MPLPPAGNPISLQDLRTEFGDTDGNPLSLNEFYRGGPNVPSFTMAGASSFAGAPLTPQAPATIPTSGPLQLSVFYDTQATIFGTTGIVTAPAAGVNYFRDYTLPAGVRYLRFLLVGGGGGGGAGNIQLGGDGGGGSMMYGTVDTNAFGNIANSRTLRVFVGKGGQGGVLAQGNSVATPARTSEHGYPMVPRTFGPWSAWMNTYAVNNDQTLIAGGSSYIGTFSFVRYIYFPVSGIYSFQGQVDNSAVVNLNGTNIMSFSNNFNVVAPLTTNVFVSAGPQRLTITYSSSAGPAGVALRILDPSLNELWTTRYDQFTAPGLNSGFPTGGNGGYSGQTGASGYGGAGGSATWFAIIDGPNFFPVALAGGGGGGGGGGHVAYAYINGNTRTQHHTRVSTVSGAFRFVGGGEGEFIGQTNNGQGPYYPAGTVTWPLVSELYDDGGGGGGGGGGLSNDRFFVTDPARQFLYSGMGGKRGHFYPSGDWDGNAEGGESGRSWLHPSAVIYADFVHRPTTSRSPNLPSTLPGGASGMIAYGIGGSRSAVQNDGGFIGIDGAAFFDWGYTNPSVAAVSVPASTLASSAFPLSISRARETEGDMIFLADAWGGGGQPSETGYTYSWQYHSGDSIGFSSPSSPRTNVTTSGVNETTPNRGGVIRCVVSDGATSATSFITWQLQFTPPLPPEST